MGAEGGIDEAYPSVGALGTDTGEVPPTTKDGAVSPGFNTSDTASPFALSPFLPIRFSAAYQHSLPVTSDTRRSRSAAKNTTVVQTGNVRIRQVTQVPWFGVVGLFQDRTSTSQTV